MFWNVDKLEQFHLQSEICFNSMLHSFLGNENRWQCVLGTFFVFQSIKFISIPDVLINVLKVFQMKKNNEVHCELDVV